MKFNCGKTFQEKKAERCTWHRWFAWHPVRVGAGECRWLEYVERMARPELYQFGNLEWRYQAID